MYDLIVIGDDLSSHVAAAYAAQNGLNTLLIAQTGLGGLKLIGDYLFNVDCAPVTGLGPDQPGRSILAEMGIDLPDSESTALNPSYQVILPDHRIDFFNDPDKLFSELAREFPQQDEPIRDFYSVVQDTSAVLSSWISAHPHIQPKNISEYFSYLKLYPYVFRYKVGAVKFDKVLSQHPALEKVWEAQHALLASNLSDMFSFGSALQYCAPLSGVSSFRQGKQFLFNELIQKIEASKGLYLSRHEIVSQSMGKVIDLEIKANDGTSSKVSGQQMIISTKSNQLAKISDKPINFSDRIRPSNIAYYPFTLFLGILKKCLPERIASHIAVVPEIHRDLFNDNLIILETDLPEKEISVDDARKSFSATIFIPPDPEKWTWDALKKKADTIIEKLEFFLPFLRDSIDLNNVDQSIDISLAYRNVVTPKYEVSNAFFTSFAAKSNKTRFENVFLTGAPLLTDAGFDAEILSGKNAAREAIKKRKS